MSSGEHMIQNQLAISMMLNKKFKTKSGEISLWDSYKVKDGKLVQDEEVAKQWSEKERILFAEKIAAVYQRIHGIYNTKDSNALQQYAVGRWAMQFRKWLRPGFLRRFEGMEKLFYDKDSKFRDADYNERLESEVEGNYVTALRYINAIKGDLLKMKFLTVGQKFKSLPEWKQANLRRALGEAVSYMLLLVLPNLLWGDDEPEELSRWDNQMKYNFARVQSELGFYTTTSFFEILRTPMANMTSIEAYFKFAEQLFSDGTSIIFGGDVDRYKRKTGRYEKGDPKLMKRFHNILPFKELWTDPKDKLKYFDLK